LHRFLRPSEQPDVELAAREQHVIERFVEIGSPDRDPAIPADAGLCGAPHQFLDEGCADAPGAPCGLADEGFIERQAFAVELDQLAATDVVRQRDLDRLVDPAGPVLPPA
jgi:hypothetical protein